MVTKSVKGRTKMQAGRVPARLPWFNRKYVTNKFRLIHAKEFPGEHSAIWEQNASARSFANPVLGQKSSRNICL
jgi:hypothetical protein